MFVVEISRDGKEKVSYWFDEKERAIQCFNDNDRLGFMCALYNMK